MDAERFRSIGITYPLCDLLLFSLEVCRVFLLSSVYWKFPVMCIETGLFAATLLEAQWAVKSSWCRIMKKTLGAYSELPSHKPAGPHGPHLLIEGTIPKLSFLQDQQLPLSYLFTVGVWGVYLQIPTDSKVTRCWAAGLTQQLQMSGTLNAVCLVLSSL